MVPVVLSILLVVLMSGAVLWVVAGDLTKPTSAAAAPVETPPQPSADPLPAPRRPATSRRRAIVTAPATLLDQPEGVSATFRSAPLARHRARSGVLLVLLAVMIGVAVAAVIAVIVVSLAFAVRSAVTS